MGHRICHNLTMNAVVNKAFDLEKMLTSVTSYLKRNSQVLPTVVEVTTLCTPIGCLTTDSEETHTHTHTKRHRELGQEKLNWREHI